VTAPTTGASLTAVPSLAAVPALAPVAALAAGLPALAAAFTGAAPVAVAALATLGLPVTVALALRPRAGGAAFAIGAAHLLLLPLCLLGAQGQDLRVPLTGALLAVAGLQAARLRSRRELTVATLVQLAVLTSVLSQLDGDRSTVTAAVLSGGWGLCAALQLHLLTRAAAGPPGRRDPRVAPALLATALVAALGWLLIPQPAGGPRGSRGADAGSAQRAGGEVGEVGADGAGARAGQARVGLTARDDLDLRVRGSGSQRPVLELRTDAEDGLLRAQVFDSYDGRGWSRHGKPLTDLGPGPRHDVPTTAADGDASAATHTEVRLLQPQDTLLAGGRALEVGLSGQVVVDGLGDVNAGPLPTGATYLVAGGVPTTTTRAGRLTAPADAARWLALPSTLPPRVRDIARAWAGDRVAAGQGAAGQGGADRGAPAGVVAELEARMRATLRYTLRSPVPPAGQDAVDHVLFNARSGFCEQFASVEAVLLRSLGIPSRLVSGYSIGGAGGGANGNTSGPVNAGGALAGSVTVVRDSDAHAWVQYWTPGRGWVDTDPTVGIPLAGDAPPQSRMPLLRLLRRLSALGWFVLIGVAVVLLAVAGVLVARRRRASAPPVGAAEGVGASAVRRGPVGVAFARLEAALAAAGAGRRRDETPAELLLRVPGGWRARVQVLLALEREAWGPGEPTEEQTAAAVQGLEQLAGSVRAAASPADGVPS